MATILADDIFKCIFLNDRIPIQISRKCVPDGPIDNNPALPFGLGIGLGAEYVGDKPLSELMLTRFTGAYMRLHPTTGPDDIVLENINKYETTGDGQWSGLDQFRNWNYNWN